MFNFKFTIEAVKKTYRRSFKSISKVAFGHVGQWMHRNFPDKRFKESHAKAAGYTPRKENYVKSKIRRIAKLSGKAVESRESFRRVVPTFELLRESKEKFTVCPNTLEQQTDRGCLCRTAGVQCKKCRTTSKHAD